MVEVMERISSEILNAYNIVISSVPSFFQTFVNLFLIVLLIFIYSWFIWKLYKFIATKNILGLNLNKYNKSKHPFLTKLVAGALYFAEYIIILPFIIFFWFSIFTLFLILLTENLEIQNLLIISATIVAAIRMASYYSEDLSKDLAKLLPFTLLAVSILNPDFFNIERILNQFSAIPGFFSQIANYLIFIIVLEMILRSFDFLFSLFGLEEAPKTKEDEKTKVEEETEEE
jgi:hypothetical protein